ncbi:MAG: choline dehydrogenase [bacterium]|nr:MAG: choline dehydrogenase [bacterium]
MAVGDDLELDVARLLEVALHIDSAVAEGGGGLGLGGLDGLDEVFGGQGDLHAASAAAGGGFDDQGEADGLRGRDGVLDGLDLAGRARNAGDAGFKDSLFGGDLVAHDPDVLGLGPDEGHAVGFDDLGEAGVLGQEAVAGVDGLGAGDLGSSDDRRDIEVALGRRSRPDTDALVGQPDPHGTAVRFGVHGDGGDAHLLAGAVDPQGDFAAVGDEDLGEHIQILGLTPRAGRGARRTRPAGRHRPAPRPRRRRGEPGSGSSSSSLRRSAGSGPS